MKSFIDTDCLTPDNPLRMSYCYLSRSFPTTRLNVQEIKIPTVECNVRLVNIRVSYLGYVEL